MRGLISLFCVVFLAFALSGCQQSPSVTATPALSAATSPPPTPTDTPIPPTEKPTPTATPVPPTETPIPTDTPMPPTETPTQAPTATPTVEPTPVAGPPLGETWARPADDMMMVSVPGGKFKMGSNKGDLDYALEVCDEYYGRVQESCRRDWFKQEQPVHVVVLDGFWIDHMEVTNAQYRKCVEAGVCDPPKEGILPINDSYYGNSTYDDYPVVYVSWHQAAGYCEWAGVRLPTEAEWEYAARGPEGWRYPWGDMFDGTQVNYCDVNCKFNWADESVDDGYGYTAPVGSYPGGVSWCGAQDLAGNVWEWVADWYDSTYYAHSPSRNPPGPSSGEGRVRRGGSWHYSADGVRGASRYGVGPGASNDYLGFRCAKDAVAIPADATTPTQTLTATVAPPPSASAPGDTWTRPVDGMIMAYIPAIEFEIGSSDAEIDAALEQCERDRGSGQCEREWFEDESPRHSVTPGAFWIDQTEVTNAQFAAFLNEQRKQDEGGVSWLELEDEVCLVEQVDGEFRPKAGYADHPVIKVSWYGAKAYCGWVGGRLPTEAKWEYAARGPEGRIYPWGDDAPTCKQANFSGCQGSTMPVGSLLEGVSWCGAQDMAGNVWEWVANWYLPYPDSQHENEDFGRTFKVVRGGSWKFESYYVRAAQRNLEYMPDVRSDQIGFRCEISVGE